VLGLDGGESLERAWDRIRAAERRVTMLVTVDRAPGGRDGIDLFMLNSRNTGWVRPQPRHGILFYFILLLLFLRERI
jgi:hypothetical protein